MQGGPVDELLDIVVERPAVNQLEVEIGRTLEDRIRSRCARAEGGLSPKTTCHLLLGKRRTRLGNL